MRSIISSRLPVVVCVWAFVSIFSPISHAESTSAINFDEKMFGKLSAEERELLLEYEKNLRVLKDCYENVTIIAEFRTYDYLAGAPDDNIPSNPAAAPTLRQLRMLEYRGNCTVKDVEYFRVDDLCVYNHPRGAGPFEAINAKGFVSKTIGIANPVDAYLLRKDDKAAKFYTLLGTQKVAIGYAHPDYYRYPCAAFAPTGISLEHYLFHKPGFAVKNKLNYVIDYVRFSEEAGRDEKIVEMKTSFGSPVENAKGEYLFTFLPARSWVIKEMTYNSINFSWNRTCTYEGEFEGIPLLKELVVEFANPKKDGDGLSAKEVFTIRRITPGAVPLAEFDVKQFLPPGD